MTLVEHVKCATCYRDEIERSSYMSGSKRWQQVQEAGSPYGWQWKRAQYDGGCKDGK